jgi:hypothetical protein
LTHAVLDAAITAEPVAGWTLPGVAAHVSAYAVERPESLPGMHVAPYGDTQAIVYVKTVALLDGSPLAGQVWAWIVARRGGSSTGPVEVTDSKAVTEEGACVSQPPVVTQIDLVKHFGCADGDARHGRLMAWPVPANLDDGVVFGTALVRGSTHRTAWIAMDHPFLAALRAWLDAAPDTKEIPRYEPAFVKDPAFPGTDTVVEADPWTALMRTSMTGDAREAFRHAGPAYAAGAAAAFRALAGPLSAEHVRYLTRTSAPHGWIAYPDLCRGLDAVRHDLLSERCLLPQIAGQLWRAAHPGRANDDWEITTGRGKRYNVRVALPALRTAAIITLALMRGGYTGSQRGFLVNQLRRHAVPIL